MDKILIVIGDAAEAMDTLYPYYRVQEEGFESVVAAPEKRRYHLVIHEIPPGWEVTPESPSYHWNSDVAFRDIEPSEYFGLFISGGRAPEYLRYDRHLMGIVRHFFEAGKPGGLGLPRSRDPGGGGRGPGTARGNRVQVSIRCRGVWRDLRRPGLRAGRQPGERPHLA